MWSPRRCTSFSSESRTRPFELTSPRGWTSCSPISAAALREEIDMEKQLNWDSPIGTAALIGFGLLDQHGVMTQGHYAGGVRDWVYDSFPEPLVKKFIDNYEGI